MNDIAVKILVILLAVLAAAIVTLVGMALYFQWPGVIGGALK